MKQHDQSEQGNWVGAEADAGLEARVDAYLDRELDEPGRRALARELRQHPRVARELAATRRMLDELARPVEAPDLESRVIAGLSRRRRFIPESWRRAVTIGRLAAAIGLVALISGIVLTRREVPELAFVSSPKPVSAVVDSTQAGAMDAVRGAADAVQAMQSSPRSVPRGFISTELRMTPPATVAASVADADMSGSGPNVEAVADRLAIARPSIVFVASSDAFDAAIAQASAASPWFSSVRVVQAGLGIPKPTTAPWSP